MYHQVSWVDAVHIPVQALLKPPLVLVFELIHNPIASVAKSITIEMPGIISTATNEKLKVRFLSLCVNASGHSDADEVSNVADFRIFVPDDMAISANVSSLLEDAGDGTTTRRGGTISKSLTQCGTVLCKTLKV